LQQAPEGACSWSNTHQPRKKPDDEKPLALILVALAGAAHGDDFSTRVVDGLGNPIAGVSVRLEVLCELPGAKVKSVTLVKFTTDGAGKVAGSYPGGKQCSDLPPEVELRKDGFAGYTDTQFKPEYTLLRQVRSKDLERVVSLKGESQRLALRDVILGERNDDKIAKDLDELLLSKTSLIHDALLSLATDEHAKKQASEFIATLALPDDMARILPMPPSPEKGDAYENRWVYSLVTGLIEPTTDSEWELLKRAECGDYDDLWVDAGAIQSLRLNASAHGRAILQEVATRNPDRKKMVDRATAYIDGGAKPIADADLIEAGKKAAHAIGFSGWQGNHAPRYSENRETALVDASFIIDRDLLVYTATFQHVGDQWRLRAIRETMQALLAMDPKEGAAK